MGLLLGAGTWLVVQGIKNTNHNRLIVGVVIVTLTVIFGLMQLGGEWSGFGHAGLERRSWLPLAIQVGMMIAFATTVVIFGQLFFGSLQNRIVRRIAIIAAVILATWWLSQNRSELLVFLNRVVATVAHTISG